MAYSKLKSISKVSCNCPQVCSWCGSFTAVYLIKYKHRLSLDGSYNYSWTLIGGYNVVALSLIGLSRVHYVCVSYMCCVREMNSESKVYVKEIIVFMRHTHTHIYCILTQPITSLT